MGQAIQTALTINSHGFRLIGGSDAMPARELAQALAQSAVEAIVDFSTPDGNALLLKAVTIGKIKNRRVLIGTTGLSPKALDAWGKAAKAQSLTLLVAPNTSIGVLVGLKAALVAVAPLFGLGFDVEIVETHHRAKKDAPSGTARFFADNLAHQLKGATVTTQRKAARQPQEIGVHAVRGGGVFGEHEIRILGDHEELKISHRAFSRQLFATGALVLAGWLMQQKPGRHILADIDVKDLGS